MQRLMILLGVTALATVALYVWGFVVPVEVPATTTTAVARPVAAAPSVPGSSAVEPPVSPLPGQVEQAPAQVYRPAAGGGRGASPIPAVPPEPEVVDVAIDGGSQPDMGEDVIGDGAAPEDMDEEMAADTTNDPTEMNRRIMEEYQAELDRQAELQQMEYARVNPVAEPEPEPEVEEPPPQDETQPVD